MSRPINVFTYGTLMYERVWVRVVGTAVPREKAILKGYLRRRIKKDVYPVIFPGEGEVDGVLYQGLSVEDLSKLDAFEGDYYLRAGVTVETEPGCPAEAYTYVLKGEYHRLIDGEWNRTEFESHGLLKFLEDYEGFGKY